MRKGRFVKSICPRYMTDIFKGRQTKRSMRLIQVLYTFGLKALNTGKIAFLWKNRWYSVSRTPGALHIEDAGED